MGRLSRAVVCMNADFREYLIIIRLDEQRTQEIPITAHSAWAARAQLHQLNPGARVLAIRTRYRDPVK
jgi:hypothetical protein